MTWLLLMGAACVLVLYLLAWICSDPFEDVVGEVEAGEVEALRRGMRP